MSEIPDGGSERKAPVTPTKRHWGAELLGWLFVGLLIFGLGGALWAVTLPFRAMFARKPPSAGQAAARAAEDAELASLSRFTRNCEAAVRSKLTVPDSAKFSSDSSAMANGQLTGSLASGRSWHGKVEATNAFGAPASRAFSCATKPGNETVEAVIY